ncbi:MAG: TolC family protein [Alphaproteobacteria bacterium]
MRKLFLSIFLFFFCVCRNLTAETFVGEDLSNSLSNLYSFNPKIKYEREILKSKDELLPRAFSEFRPEIKGYYQKGKIDTNSEGFNISSDGIRTETNKGVVVSQNVFDGGSSLSQIKVAKNEILSQRRLLKNMEQEVFLDAIRLYADLATEISNIKVKKKNVELLKRKLELTKHQFEIVEVTLTDVSISEARFSLAESELMETSNIINSINAKYLSVFGEKPNKPEIKIPIDFDDFEIENLKLTSKKNNPKIEALVFLIKSIENEISSLKRKRLPSLKLEAEAKINQGYFRTDSEREVLSAFAKVDIPLYQSGLASSEIREAKTKLFAQKELLRSEHENLTANLISSNSSYNYSLSRIKAYEKQIESNKIYLDGLKQEFQLGERTTLDVLDGEQELLQSELDLIKAYKDLFISYYEILFYIGKLNAKDLKLNVNLFDEKENYEKVKGKWLDIIE